MIDTIKLRELAQKATPGPWWHDYCNPADGHALAWLGNWFVEIKQRVPYNSPQEDAEFIATANPAAILELLDRLEAAERDAKRFEWLYQQNALLADDTFIVCHKDFEDGELETVWVGGDLRAAIDAAMQEQNK